MEGDKGELGRWQPRHILGTGEDFGMVEGGCVTRDEAAELTGHATSMLELLGSVCSSRKQSL